MSEKKQTKQQAPFVKAKVGISLGFGTPSHFRAKTFRPKFNPSTFKTQHKG